MTDRPNCIKVVRRKIYKPNDPYFYSLMVDDPTYELTYGINLRTVPKFPNAPIFVYDYTLSGMRDAFNYKGGGFVFAAYAENLKPFPYGREKGTGYRVPDFDFALYSDVEAFWNDTSTVKNLKHTWHTRPSTLLADSVILLHEILSKDYFKKKGVHS